MSRTKSIRYLENSLVVSLNSLGSPAMGTSLCAILYQITQKCSETVRLYRRIASSRSSCRRRMRRPHTRWSSRCARALALSLSSRLTTRWTFPSDSVHLRLSIAPPHISHPHRPSAHPLLCLSSTASTLCDLPELQAIRHFAAFWGRENCSKWMLGTSFTSMAGSGLGFWPLR